MAGVDVLAAAIRRVEDDVTLAKNGMDLAALSASEAAARAGWFREIAAAATEIAAVLERRGYSEVALRDVRPGMQVRGWESFMDDDNEAYVVDRVEERAGRVLLTSVEGYTQSGLPAELIDRVGDDTCGLCAGEGDVLVQEAVRDLCDPAYTPVGPRRMQCPACGGTGKVGA